MKLNVKTMMLNLVLSVVMIFGLLSASLMDNTAQAQTTDMNPTMEAIASTKPYVVSVVNLQQAQQNIFTQDSMEPGNTVPAGTGSGVVYKLEDDYAYIVTNHHVIEGAREVTITTEAGDTYDAEVLGSDVWTDLAVLRVEAGNIDGYIEFANSDDLVVGETAIAIGSPLGEVFSGSVSKGIVSGLDRSVPVNLSGYGTPDWEANVIQTDAAINPGN